MTSTTNQASIQRRVTAARKQLAWVPLTTLVDLVKDAKAGLEDEGAFVAELCKTWKECQPDLSKAAIDANARAMMTLARHGA